VKARPMLAVTDKQLLLCFALAVFFLTHQEHDCIVSTNPKGPAAK
jgi:hypothetical protein